MPFLPWRLQSMLSATRAGELRVEVSADDEGSALDAVYRVEQEIHRHRPAALSRDGCSIVYRGSRAAATMNALSGVGRSVIRIDRGGMAYRARWELSFSRVRMALGAWAVIGALGPAGAMLLQAPRPLSGQTVQFAVMYALLVPVMATGLFAAGKSSACERVEKLLRRALAL